MCRGRLSSPQPVEVCGNCHADMHMSGALRVETTGEFAAMSDERINQLMQQGQESDVVPGGEISCTYCGKGKSQVKKILTHGGHAICNECVALCADIMSVELGSDWK